MKMQDEDTVRLQESALELKNKIENVDFTNVLKFIKCGTKVSFTVLWNNNSSDSVEGFFVHYSKANNLITIIKRNEDIEIFNLDRIINISFSDT